MGAKFSNGSELFQSSKLWKSCAKPNPLNKKALLLERFKSISDKESINYLPG